MKPTTKFDTKISIGKLQTITETEFDEEYRKLIKSVSATRISIKPTSR
jgi:hypothetical protein